MFLISLIFNNEYDFVNIITYKINYLKRKFLIALCN